MNDLPQTFMEPLLFNTAYSRGAQPRMSCEYLWHAHDKDGATVTVKDRLTDKNFTVRPDRHVAWRAQSLSKSPAKDLATALHKILGV
jgi:hypothetical protein